MNKNKKYKVLCCCGAGNGTCQLLARTTKAAFVDLGIKVQVEAAPATVGLSQGNRFDIILANAGLAKKFLPKVDQSKTTVIGLKNIMSVEEIKEKLDAID